MMSQQGEEEHASQESGNNSWHTAAGAVAAAPPTFCSARGGWSWREYEIPQENGWEQKKRRK